MWKRIKLWYWRFEESLTVDDLYEIRVCMPWLNEECMAYAISERNELRKQLKRIRKRIADLEA